MTNYSNRKIKGFYNNKGSNTAISGVMNLRENSAAVGSFSMPYHTRYFLNGSAVTGILRLDPNTGEAVNIGTISMGSTVYCFSQNEDHIAAGTSTAGGYITILKRVPGTFNFTLILPVSQPAAYVQSLDYGVTTDGVYLITAGQTSPYIKAYKRSGDTYTALSIPNLTGVGNEVKFSPDDGKYIWVSPSGLYKRTGDTFQKLTSPSLAAYSAQWDPTGRYLYTSVGSTTSSQLRIYELNNDALTLVVTDTHYLGSTSIDTSMKYLNNKQYLIQLLSGYPYIAAFKIINATTLERLANPLVVGNAAAATALNITIDDNNQIAWLSFAGTVADRKYGYKIINDVLTYVPWNGPIIATTELFYQNNEEYL